MSCAVFTFIGLYSAYAGKSSHWVAVASSFAAIALFLVASYGAWHQEHKRAEDAIAENKKQLSEAQAESQPKPNLQQAWNELASKFESLASNSVTKHVRADWICQRNNNRTIYEQWAIAGVGNPTQIESLCRYAGTLLAKSPTVLQHMPVEVTQEQNSVWRWLFLLKNTSPYFRQDSSVGRDGAGTLYFMGDVRELAAASVNVCIECATAEMP